MSGAGCRLHPTAHRNADGECMPCFSERTADGIAAEDALRPAPPTPSNDEPEAVRVEMRAAELVGTGFERMTDDERRGYLGHSERDFSPSDTEVAGWLAHEINQSDYWREQRDADAWSWDPTRPLAEQWTTPELTALVEGTGVYSAPEGDEP